MAMAAPALRAEVAGDVRTLLEMIEGEEIETPSLLSWNEWVAWRAGEGRRPAVHRGDAAGTTPAVEADIWRTVMAAVHGVDWAADLRALQQASAAARGGSQVGSAILTFDGGGVGSVHSGGSPATSERARAAAAEIAAAERAGRRDVMITPLRRITDGGGSGGGSTGRVGGDFVSGQR